jgi:hypothetical protein
MIGNMVDIWVKFGYTLPMDGDGGRLLSLIIHFRGAIDNGYWLMVAYGNQWAA